MNAAKKPGNWNESLAQGIRMSYTSEAVDIDSNFLKSWSHDQIHPPTVQRIDFVASNLPEYKDHYACVIDNVLTPEECSTMLRLAEASAGGRGWQPALINVTADLGLLQPDYRNSDRIIWDSPEIVTRLWQRFLECAEGLESDLAVVDSLSEDGKQRQKADSVLGYGAEKGEVWDLVKVNERMRFLKYGEGQFFAAHCDSSYEPLDNSEHWDRTLYTIQLYLNDDGVSGGATTFWGRDNKRRLDVEPRLGRVLIFQHRRLRHSGEVVMKGQKYTMRTDIMFRLRKKT